MNEVDGENKTEKICRGILDAYPLYAEKCQKIRRKIVNKIEKLEEEDTEGVYLHTSRVKILKSMLRKVITKRHERLCNINDPYSTINEKNYQDVITDLVGVRLIMSYRGDWQELHQKLVSMFPYVDDEEYEKAETVPHKKGRVFLAQIPIANHAKEDDLTEFHKERIRTKFRETGYRSIHYVISYRDVYVELQVRTIYDEAWSDCDHRYVYEHEDNSSYYALNSMSAILCSYTNISNDLGEVIRKVFLTQAIQNREDGSLETTKDIELEIEKIKDRYETAQQLLEEFRKQLVVKEGR